MQRRSAGPPRGLLRPAAPAAEREHRRILPRPELAGSIAHFWWVRWDLREPFTAETLPHPTAHLVFEPSSDPPRAEVVFVPSGRFIRTLSGAGQVLGIKFRPAAFQPLLDGSMAARTGTTAPIESILGAPGAALAAAMSEVLPTGDLERAIRIAEAHLAALLTPLAAEVAALRDLVEQMESDRTLLRVEDAALRVGMDVRGLQRRFARYVGVSPKWVIQRYRLHEAAERLASETPPPLAALAAELGYFDQPHFVRDFRRVVGAPPGQYARRGR